MSPSDRPFPHRTARRRLLRGCLVAAVVAAAPAAVAQQQSSKVETVTTPDGWTLPVQVTLPGDAGEETPAVVLIHGAEESRKNWESLATFLAGKGYAVLVPDLRLHGEASNPSSNARADRLSPNDYKGMVLLDMEAVKTLLLDLHARKKINVRKLGLVAAEEGAPVAMLFAYNDWAKQPLPDAPAFAARTPTGQDVRALVLMSPEDSVPGLNASAVARKLSDDALDVGFFVVVGDRDAEDGGDAEKLYNRLGGRRDDRADRVRAFVLPGIPLRGTTLLRDPVGENVKTEIGAFLDRAVKNRSDPWRSREGRI